MDKYRSKIKLRMFLSVVIVVLCFGLGILDQIGFVDKLGFFKKSDVISGFQLGFLTGIGLVALVMLFKYSKAIKDDIKLQMLYNKENDERLGSIRQKAGMPMLMITSSIMIFAGIIAGYVNEIVIYTLILTAIIQMTLGGMVKIYYMKKM